MDNHGYRHTCITSMTYSQPQQPQQPQQPVQTAVLANLAFFPFTTRDGTPPKPGSPQFTGSLQLSIEQLQELLQWASQQAPDEYGKIKVQASLWDTISKDGTKRYLKGNVKAPVSQQQQAMHQQVAWNQQQAMASATQAAYGPQAAPMPPQGAYAPQAFQAPQQPAYGQPNPHIGPTGQPLPAWTNDQASMQQYPTSVTPPTPAAAPVMPSGPSTGSPMPTNANGLPNQSTNYAPPSYATGNAPVQQPMAQQPMAQQPMAQQPMAQQPMADDGIPF